jgi:hypothetical protein
MIEWRVIKFKHYRRAIELQNAGRQDGAGQRTLTSEAATAYLEYAISLIHAWDFVDAETSEALPVAAASLDELSVEQLQELIGGFGEKLGTSSAIVPKASAAPSSSTSTE